MNERKGPPPEKPKIIDVLEVRRTRRFITIKYKHGDDTHTLKTNEAPLPEFGQALDALADVARTVVEAPEEWTANLSVTGFKHEAFRDVRAASILISKGIAASGKVLKVTTPAALLAQPQTEGAFTPPLKADHVALVEEAIEQAKRYILGERAQGTLPLQKPEESDPDEPAEPVGGEEMDLGDKRKKPRKKRGEVISV